MFRRLLLLSLAGKVVSVLLWRGLGWEAMAAGCFFGPDFYILYSMFVPAAQGLVRVRTRFATDEREIWLTIDDGPDEQDTPQILEALDRHGARATFFLIGRNAGRHPGLVAEIARRGHDIGYHTQTHPTRTFWCATPERLRWEFKTGLDFLAGMGVKPLWFRAPVGIKNPFLERVLAEHGLICVGWRVRSLDTLSRDPERVVRRVMKQVKPGAIVLLHEGRGVHQDVRVKVIGRLLQELDQRGYRCVVPAPEQLL